MTRDARAPFPFVGAGEAEYFEWAEVHVCFTRSPRPAQREPIAVGVPPPLRDSIDWNGPLLAVASAQGVGRYIRSAYSKKKPPVTRLTTQSRFTQASASADARFNADIERWLLEAHQVVPILLAYRRQDWEAGGTRLSSWHEESVREAAELLARLEKVAKGRLGAAGYLARGVAEEARRAGVAVPPGLVARFAVPGDDDD
jgi:hypothetical protein